MSRRERKMCIIGGLGYVGSALLQEFSSDTDVTVVDINRSAQLEGNHRTIFSDYAKLDAQFYEGFDIIILLAGNSAVSQCKSMTDTLEENICKFCGLLDKIASHQQFLYASSCSVYGRLPKDVCADETTALPSAVNFYDLSKRSIDDFALLSGKHVYGLRFGTVCGYSSHVREDLVINAMVNTASESGNIRIYDGHARRAILGISDLRRAVRKIVEMGTYRTAGIYNLASFNTTIKDIAYGIRKLFKSESALSVALIHDTNVSKYQYDFAVTTRKFCSTFGFEFIDDLAHIVHTLLEHPDRARSPRPDSQFPECSPVQECRNCGGFLMPILDLGTQPLANSYHACYEVLDKYPLCFCVCSYCFLGQLNCVVSPAALFRNYLYVSGTSSTLRDYFKWFAELTLAYVVEKSAKPKVLDIACNDGSQLDAYKQLGCVTIGVDPALNLTSVASEKGHTIFPDYFDDVTAYHVADEFGLCDIITAQNVFAHVHDIHNFLECAKRLLSRKGRLFIQTSQARMIERGEFDTIYHEHLSFFNCRCMRGLVSKHGLVLENVYTHEIHGTSRIYVIAHKGDETVSPYVDELIAEETRLGTYSIATYTGTYKHRCLTHKASLEVALLKYLADGYMLCGYGSTAKSNTLLNTLNPGITSEIKYIFDENPLKQGLLTPGTDIKIVSPDNCIHLLAHRPTLMIIFAWNFYDEIVRKIVGMRHAGFEAPDAMLLMNVATFEIAEL